MKQPLKYYRISILHVVLLVMLMLAGCSSSKHRRLERILVRHPMTDTRMSMSPGDGYVPTCIWRVKGTDCAVYLAGTVHMVQATDIPFPSAYYAVYQAADIVYVENKGPDDLSWLAKTMLGFKMVRHITKIHSTFFCSKGEQLEDHLSDRTVTALKDHFGKEYRKKRSYTPLGLVFMESMEEMESNELKTAVWKPPSWYRRRGMAKRFDDWTGRVPPRPLFSYSMTWWPCPSMRLTNAGQTPL